MYAHNTFAPLHRAGGSFGGSRVWGVVGVELGRVGPAYT